MTHSVGGAQNVSNYPRKPTSDEKQSGGLGNCVETEVSQATLACFFLPSCCNLRFAIARKLH
jgi:hypothetical protein